MHSIGPYTFTDTDARRTIGNLNDVWALYAQGRARLWLDGKPLIDCGMLATDTDMREAAAGGKVWRMQGWSGAASGIAIGKPPHADGSGFAQAGNPVDQARRCTRRRRLGIAGRPASAR